MLFPVLRKRKQSISKSLGDKFGGNWEYCGAFSLMWICDDGRSVSKFYGDDDFFPSFPKYFMYHPIGSGKPTKHIHL